jgi:SAM-dependent methyltransferase
MTDLFVDPYTKLPLQPDVEGNLQSTEKPGHTVYPNHNGTYDFAVTNPELRKARELYDQEYLKRPIPDLTWSVVAESWHSKTLPWRRTMLESLGDLSGKQVLLLGNGASYQEFYFLRLGAKIIFTDMSLAAVTRMKEKFERSELAKDFRKAVQFHTVDAMHLPFRQEAFDVVYGCKFVGFLEHGDLFFSEVHRCLKPNGICRFGDDARSPAWESLKRNVVRPIGNWLLRKETIDDYRSSLQAGFTHEQVSTYAKQCGFRRTVFVREYFLVRMAQLSYGRLVRWNPTAYRKMNWLFLMLASADRCLAKTDWAKRNAIALTWGLDK